MICCPICSKENQDDVKYCERCNTHLEEYKKILYAPDILFNKGLVCLKDKNIDGAIMNFITALEFVPCDIEILNILIRICLQQKEYEKAINYMVKILELNPEDKRINELLEKASLMISERERKKKEVESILKMSFADYYKMITDCEFTTDLLK